MLEILFYKTSSGRCPVEEFFDTLSDKQFQKIAWVLRLLKEWDQIPKRYYKKLIDTDDIWEVRIQSGNDIFRILGFFERDNFIILTNGFAKKSREIPQQEIELAERRKKDYFRRKNNG